MEIFMRDVHAEDCCIFGYDTGMHIGPSACPTHRNEMAWHVHGMMRMNLAKYDCENDVKCRNCRNNQILLAKMLDKNREE